MAYDNINLIYCLYWGDDSEKDIVEVQPEDLSNRTCAFALILNREKTHLLLMKLDSGKYHLPGAVMSAGDDVEGTIMSPISKLIGINCLMWRPFSFCETYDYDDAEETGYISLNLFASCINLGGEMKSSCEIPGFECPEWVEISSLTQELFRVAMFYEVVEKYVEGLEK